MTDLNMHPATPLSLREVRVSHLRCHDALQWDCRPGLNLIVGANGSGKTTMLEAVYMMAHGRSFRQARDPVLVRNGESRFLIHGQWVRFGPMNLSVAGRRGQTTLRLQGRDVQRRKDISESFPVLVEAPQGRRVIDGAPGERRRWLDAQVLVAQPNLVSVYESYLRSVMQRARLLRRRAAASELDAWEQQIVHYGTPIVQARRQVIEQMNAWLAGETLLTESPLSIELEAREYDREAWIARLRDKREEDQRRGALRFGPHCDTVTIRYMEREIRSAGSRGQQKLAAIALKMAECAIWAQYRRLLPVVLLDDCLEALDRTRQQRLLQRLQTSPMQVLMTAPEGISIVDGVADGVDIHVQWLDATGLHDSDPGVDDRQMREKMEEAA